MGCLPQLLRGMNVFLSMYTRRLAGPGSSATGEPEKGYLADNPAVANFNGRI